LEEPVGSASTPEAAVAAAVGMAEVAAAVTTMQPATTEAAVEADLPMRTRIM
jgi:hypothetical protein